jgi:hypothetical protein
MYAAAFGPPDLLADQIQPALGLGQARLLQAQAAGRRASAEYKSRAGS